MRRTYICLAVIAALCWGQALLCDSPPSVASKVATPSSNDYIIKKSAPIVVTDEASFARAAHASVENAKTLTTTVIAIKGNVTLDNSYSLAGNIEIYPTATGCSLTCSNNAFISELIKISFTGLPNNPSKIVIGLPEKSDPQLQIQLAFQSNSTALNNMFLTIQNCSITDIENPVYPNGFIAIGKTMQVLIKDSVLEFNSGEPIHIHSGSLILQNNQITAHSASALVSCIAWDGGDYLAHHLEKKNLHSSPGISIHMENNQINCSAMGYAFLVLIDDDLGYSNAKLVQAQAAQTPQVPYAQNFFSKSLTANTKNNYGLSQNTPPKWNSYFHSRLPGTILCVSLIGNTISARMWLAGLYFGVSGLESETFFFEQDNQYPDIAVSLPWAGDPTYGDSRIMPTTLKWAQWNKTAYSGRRLGRQIGRCPKDPKRHTQ